MHFLIVLSLLSSIAFGHDQPKKSHAQSVFDKVRAYNNTYNSKLALQLPTSQAHLDSVLYYSTLFKVKNRYTINKHGLVFIIYSNYEQPQADAVQNILKEKSSYYYNTQNLIDSLIVEQYDESSTTWKIAKKSVFKYESGVKVEETLSVVLPTVGTLTPHERRLFSYNGQGLLLNETYQEWQVASGSWLTFNKWERSYNTQDLLELERSWLRTSAQTQLRVDSENHLTYTPQGVVQHFTLHIWDAQEAALQKAWQFHFGYNANLLADTVHQNFWSNTATEWKSYKRFINSYNGNKDNSQVLSQLWNSDSVRWENNELRQNSYVAKGKQSSALTQIWDNIKSDWVESRRENRSYNMHNDMVAFNAEIFAQNSWLPDDRACTVQDAGNSFEYEASHLQAWYNYNPLSVLRKGKNIPENQILTYNYPNPFNPKTEIRFYLPTSETIEMHLYNVQGKRVKSLFTGKINAGWNKIPFNAQNMPSGFYFYDIITPSRRMVHKMTLLK